MRYQINRHAHDMLWVKMEGHMAMVHAEGYFQEMWRMLDSCPRPTDLLVDGRQMRSANTSARMRTEQIVHHPHLGHIAFVVSAQHLLLFAPLMRLVSGIGLFGDEREAMAYLHSTRGAPSVPSMGLPTMPPRPAESQRIAPPPPAQGGLLGLLDSWNQGLQQISRHGDGD